MTNKLKISILILICIVLSAMELYLKPSDIGIEQFRIPRLLTGIFVAISLSTAGIIMQSIFKNPLAGPYLTGIIPGAQLFITISIVLIPFSMLQSGIATVIMRTSSIVGALFSIYFLFKVYQRNQNKQMLLLAGVVLGFFLNGFSELILSLGNAEQIKNVVIWGFGSLDNCFDNDLLFLGLISLIGLVISYLLSSRFDIYSLGSLIASNSGISPYSFILLSLAIAGVLAGVVTVLCGPISFIGMIAPQIARIFSPNKSFKYVLTYSLLIGISFILLADIASHYLLSTQLSLNAMAAILGAPIVGYTLFKQSNYYY